MNCGGCLGTIASGAVGLAKAGAQKIGLRCDQADEATIASRRAKCTACDAPTHKRDGRLTTLSRCPDCSCFIAAKTRLASQRCPRGEW